MESKSTVEAAAAKFARPNSLADKMCVQCISGPKELMHGECCEAPI